VSNYSLSLKHGALAGDCPARFETRRDRVTQMVECARQQGRAVVIIEDGMGLSVACSAIYPLTGVLSCINGVGGVFAYASDRVSAGRERQDAKGHSKQRDDRSFH